MIFMQFFDGPPLVLEERRSQKFAPSGAATREAVERGGHNQCN